MPAAMIPSGAFARVRSVALLFAALMHLAGIVDEPMLHGWLHAHPSLPGWSAPQQDDGGTPHHHDQVCAICQAAHAGTLPAPAAGPVHRVVRRTAAPPSALSFAALLDHAPVQARAPPVSIT
jgi:hypothetical protein